MLHALIVTISLDSFSIAIWLSLGMSILLTTHPIEANNEDNSLSNKFVTKEDIQTYFSVKRKQHLEAVQTLLKFQKYEQKHEMLRRIFEKIFDVIQSSRVKIENSDYVLGEDLPKNEVIEHVLYILDNCGFFGNLVLKLPDISDRLLKANNQWVDSYKWCFTFSISSNLVDEISLKMFNLAAQQLNLIPKSEDFTNPYEEKSKKNKKKSEFSTDDYSSNKDNMPKKKNSQVKKPRGPRMSKVEL